MRNLVQHEDTNKGSGRGLSGGVFRKLPLDQARDGLQPGTWTYSDFVNPSASITAGKYEGLTLTHNGVGTLDSGGAISIDPGSAVNAGLESGVLGTVDVDSDTSPIMACEFRVKMDNLEAPLICGFANDPDSAVTGSGLATGEAFIGVVKAASATVLQASLCDASAVTTYGVDSETVTAGTYIKVGVRLGHKYDKSGVEAEFYVNGSRIAVVNARIAGASLVNIASAKAFCFVEGDRLTTYAFAAAYSDV